MGIRTQVIQNIAAWSPGRVIRSWIGAVVSPSRIRMVFLLSAVALTISLTWRLSTSRKTLFPSESFSDPIAYTDGSPAEGNNGRSEVLGMTCNADGIEFRWCLHEGYAYPYAGVRFPPKQKDQDLDIRGFDRIAFDIESDADDDLRVLLRFFQHGITDRADPYTYRHWVTEADLVRGRHSLRIPFSQFSTPAWWYVMSTTRETDCGPIDTKRLMDFEIETAEMSAMNTPRVFRIHRIWLERDNTLAIWSLGLIVPTLLLLAWQIPPRMEKRQAIIAIPYEKLDLPSYESEELARVVSIMASNFHDKDLSLALVAERSRVATGKVTELIHGQFKMSFKEYLNTIRLDEARRLLGETDRYVSDIAYAVGYNSVPHFNRLFKTRFGSSPNEFRKARQGFDRSED